MMNRKDALFKIYENFNWYCGVKFGKRLHEILDLSIETLDDAQEDEETTIVSFCREIVRVMVKKEKPIDWKIVSSNFKYSLKNKFQITIEEYDKMFSKQNGCCAICGKHQTQFEKRFAIDHDHETGKIRGLLCFSCNYGLGIFKDDVNRLKKAIEYLVDQNC